MKIIENLDAYQKYLFNLLDDGHTKDEILQSDSDEILVYELYFPLDVQRECFEELSSSIINKYQNLQST